MCVYNNNNFRTACLLDAGFKTNKAETEKKIFQKSYNLLLVFVSFLFKSLSLSFQLIALCLLSKCVSKTRVS